MAEKAFLFYGFDLDDALLVKNTIEEALGTEIDAISASGEENATLEAVLDRMPDAMFTEQADRFLMFLGFSDEDISACIKAFPKIKKRPILCTLTENNMKWTISHLLEHLIEEDLKVRGKSCSE